MKFYGVGLKVLKYDHAEYGISILKFSQYDSNMHANKQLVNSENWTLK